LICFQKKKKKRGRKEGYLGNMGDLIRKGGVFGEKKVTKLNMIKSKDNLNIFDAVGTNLLVLIKYRD
jgi:hypothetical protein